MDFFSDIELAHRGLWKGCFDLDNEKKLDKFAFVWVDKDQKYFISNTSSLEPGMPYGCYRLRHVDYIPNEYPVCGEFEINQPRVDEIYYSRNLNIDGSNRTREYYFQLERKLQIRDWSIRVNNSIIGMNDVDTYYVGNACEWWDDNNPAEFYYNIAEEIIDNRWNEIRT